MVPANANVEEFAEWWMTSGKPFKSPAGSIRSYDGIMGVTLFRDGQFQVQLFIGEPRTSAPAHRHPNIDTLDIVVAGRAIFDAEFSTPDRNHQRIRPDELHAAKVGTFGGCFISIQKWLNGVEPSSVEMDWVGEPMDTNHAVKLLEQKAAV